MKYSKLKEIIESEAHILKEYAAYNGEWNDGGSTSLIQQLMDFKDNLVIQYDLRPSEFSQLNEKEVGEPKKFSDIIKRHKYER